MDSEVKIPHKNTQHTCDEHVKMHIEYLKVIFAF